MCPTVSIKILFPDILLISYKLSFFKILKIVYLENSRFTKMQSILVAMFEKSSSYLIKNSASI